MKICITGAGGFIGKNLCDFLSKKNYDVIALSSSEINFSKKKNYNCYKIDYFSKNLDLSSLIKDFDCLIHCAGKAHQKSKNSKKEFSEYRKINTELTRILAVHAKKNNVKNFIFLSTVGVNGANTQSNNKFKYNDIPNPRDIYSISKLEAEKFLNSFSKKNNLNINIVRLPLVYGPGAKGNFLRLMKLVERKIPLPIKRIKNSRSFLNIDNFLSFIEVLIKNKDVTGETFLISDKEDISTIKLIEKIAFAMKKKIFFIHIPIFILKIISFIFLKKKEIDKLTLNLQIDCDRAYKILKWKPTFSLDDGINKMVGKFLER